MRVASKIEFALQFALRAGRYSLACPRELSMNAQAAVWPMSGEATAERATEEDPGRAISDILTLSACVASLAAVGIVLVRAHAAHGTAEFLLAGLGLLSVAASWVTVHTIFMLRYARCCPSCSAPSSWQPPSTSLSAWAAVAAERVRSSPVVRRRSGGRPRRASPRQDPRPGRPPGSSRSVAAGSPAAGQAAIPALRRCPGCGGAVPLRQRRARHGTLPGPQRAGRRRSGQGNRGSARSAGQSGAGSCSGQSPARSRPPAAARRPVLEIGHGPVGEVVLEHVADGLRIEQAAGGN